MATHLDLADAQFQGFNHGKKNKDDIVGLVKSMGLTRWEWRKWKRSYPTVLDESDVEAIERYFNKESKS